MTKIDIVGLGAHVTEKANPPGFKNWGLVVVDMQNDFLAAGGYYARRSDLDKQARQRKLTAEKRDHLLSQPSTAPPGGFRYRVTSLSPVVANVCKTIEQARMKQRPIAYLKAVYSREFDVQPPFLRLEPARKHSPCKRTTWGADFIEPINQLIAARQTTPDERVIEKHTFDGFFQTELLSFLRERRVQTVAIMGVETHACVLATAQSASVNQFKTLILEDCIWTAKEELGQGALAIFRDAFGSTARAHELFAWRDQLAVASRSQPPSPRSPGRRHRRRASRRNR
ncbi:MAG TPA: isochorismatase family cysteine hydrolase [Candidatus Binatia bacterium]|nr:isochorismatase family cysteine hydrolase [Candidatus Binatia bacterium]